MPIELAPATQAHVHEDLPCCVNRLLVDLQFVLSSKLAHTPHAFEWLFTTVSSHVAYEVEVPSEALRATWMDANKSRYHRLKDCSVAGEVKAWAS